MPFAQLLPSELRLASKQMEGATCTCFGRHPLLHLPNAHPQNEYYKTIANLHYVLPTFGGTVGPHTFRMRDGAATVNSRGVPLARDLSGHVVKDEIFINHYITRSAEEYAAKALRGGGMHKTGRHNISQLAWRDSISTAECLDAVRYVQRTAEGSLGADGSGDASSER